MIRRELLIALLFSLLPCLSFAQNWHTMVSVDSRVGYSSNTYLNPFFAEWDESASSGYGLVSVFGQSFWNDSNNSVDITLGLVAEPFLNNQNIWRGGLSMVEYRRRFSPDFNGGIEAGGSYFSSNFKRTMVWAQPYVTWFVSPFTSLKLKLGVNHRSYKNFSDSLNTNRRFDFYGLEFESWPTYNWQLRATLFSSLDKLPAVNEQFSSTISAGYVFLNGSSITAKAGIEQFGFDFTTTTTSGGAPVGNPGGGPPPETQTVTNQEFDRILRLGLTGDYPINKTVSIFASIEGLNRNITTSDERITDMQISGGVRLSLQPNIIRRSSNRVIEPEWEKRREQLMAMNINFSGGGRLYLVGDFNNWNRAGIPLTQQNKKTYAAEISLDSGAYEYKILHVEGDTEEWLKFSNDTYTVDDGFGGENAMLLVE
ncbi:hypothetical protein G3570_05575 [Balneolaceae bacterium YR4-1]|uniref:AMP-activated protein kinase glycogen-binding domain-containing protein n=2 Tax=Halalkalibaculum roseum TaxID=2709311 RepID=A0A6M1ST74_9BACT|nr:hypothetical protein [Halalkalibaculum roseum]